MVRNIIKWHDYMLLHIYLGLKKRRQNMQYAADDAIHFLSICEGLIGTSIFIFLLLLLKKWGIIMSPIPFYWLWGLTWIFWGIFFGLNQYYYIRKNRIFFLELHISKIPHNKLLGWTSNLCIFITLGLYTLAYTISLKCGLAVL